MLWLPSFFLVTHSFFGPPGSSLTLVSHSFLSFFLGAPLVSFCWEALPSCSFPFLGLSFSPFFVLAHRNDRTVIIKSSSFLSHADLIKSLKSHYGHDVVAVQLCPVNLDEFSLFFRFLLL